MTGRARATPASLVAVAVAVGWPFVIETTTAHRMGVHLCVLALVGLSLTVTVGWLRTPTVFHLGSVAVGGWAAARVLVEDQALPLAAVAAVVAGALVGVASLIPVLRRPRPGVVLSSLVVGTVVWGVVLPRFLVRSFTRPVVVGIDLGGDRPLYLAGLLLVVAAYAVLQNLHRSEIGRAMAAVGAAPELAARSGVYDRRTWLAGVALSGAVAGLGGLLLALFQQSVPAAASVSPVVAVGTLSIPLLGGGPWPAGALVGVALLGLAAVALGVPEPGQVILGVALVGSAVLLPGGVLGWARRQAWYATAVRLGR